MRVHSRCSEQMLMSQQFLVVLPVLPWRITGVVGKQIHVYAVEGDGTRWQLFPFFASFTFYLLSLKANF